MEIQGIPVSEQEDTNEIIKAVGSVVDVPVEDSDISISHRMKSGNAIPPIIVKFMRRCVRDAFYKARSRLNDFTIEDIGFGNKGENKIFIQESLTPARRELFHKCNKLKKRCKLRYIWSIHGNIFLRKNDATAPSKVYSEKDLVKLEAKLISPMGSQSAVQALDAGLKDVNANTTSE